MLRAAVHLTEPTMPTWPASTAPVEPWRAWLSTVWSNDAFRQTVTDASPDLAGQVQAIIDGRTPKPRRVRRAALATARYAIRYAHRSTPYSLFAGVALLGFDQSTSVRFGADHQAVVRPDPAGLDEMLSAWESDSTRMAHTEVCVNTLTRQRNEHIHVPSEGDAEFRLALNPALRLVINLARSPIEYRQLADTLAAEYPVRSSITSLVSCGSPSARSSTPGRGSRPRSRTRASANGRGTRSISSPTACSYAAPRSSPPGDPTWPSTISRRTSLPSSQ
ncbi:lantibiotic dehydratase [Streptomyces hawaiiensis]|uniref:lantibiotic dehydratase n=1 Tax=Streptomyces hawaiiensis TaxID=67305 RepID=UPI00364CD17D